jgi:sec-independent protein translocase protein TatA
MNLGMPELLIVLAIILLLFGSTRLPKLAQGLGKSIKEFKRGVNEGETAEELDEPRRERLQPSRAEYKDDLAPKRVGVNEPR